MQYLIIKFLLIFSVLFSITSTAQNPKDKYVDSLLKEAESLPHQRTFEVLHLGLKAYIEAKKANLPNQMAQSLLVAAKQEMELGSYAMALKHADEAVTISKPLNDVRLLSDSYRLKGVILGFLKRHQESQTELYKALTYAKKIADEELRKSRLGVIYNDLAYHYDESEHDHDSVISYYKRGYREFESMSLQEPLREKTRSLAYFNIGAAYLKFHKLDSAEIYLNQARQTAHRVQHSSVEVNSLEALASLHRLEKNYDKSINLYLQAIEIAKRVNDLQLLKKLYFNVSLSYDAAEDLANSKKYLNEYLVLADTLEKEGIDSENFFSEKLETLKSREGFFRKATFFILFCLGFLAIVFNIFKDKKDSKIAEADETKEIKPSIALEDQQKILRSTVQLAEKDDPSFLLIFKKSFPHFFEALSVISPNLIASEHKLCALMVLNFSTKEIAQSTNSSVRAIEAKKYRLRKKLNVPSEADINLWIIEVFKKNT